MQLWKKDSNISNKGVTGTVCLESLEDFGLMAAEQYTQDKLLELGKDNYKKLVSYCEILEVNGFWDQARQVMKKTSTQVLDLGYGGSRCL